ncbi:MAG: hypothetical protein EXR77_19970 [Myxococcales bacterium]|nr:hypothetical protein [Myxococcales bacterium]
MLHPFTGVATLYHSSAGAVWLCAGAVWLFAGAGTAAATVPATIAVEGGLFSAGGGPAADGKYSATWALYDDPKAGVPLWVDAPIDLEVSGGRFAAQIGAGSPVPLDKVAKAKLWIGLQVGADPELPRMPVHSVLFAGRAAQAEALACSGCIEAGHLAANALQGYAKASDLDGYAKATDLFSYAKLADLGSYAKTTELSNYAKAVDLQNYVKANALAKVAGSGSFADLKDVPPAVKLASACGTGLFVKGVKADGSLDCGPASLLAKELPNDGLEKVSNGVLSNFFTEVTVSAATPLPIPDLFGAGVSDIISVPDVGIAFELTVQVVLTNSDVSKVRIDLYDPVGQKATVYNGESTGTKLTSSLVSGTNPFLAAWVGKNAKGNWSIVVADLAKGTVNPDGKVEAYSVTVKTLATNKVQVNGDLVVNGAITGNAAKLLVPSGAVMAFNLPLCPQGWSEFTLAQGRAVVGLPSGGKLGAQVGAALTDQENRATGKHTHTVTDPGHTHTVGMDSDSVPDGGTGATASEDSQVYQLNSGNSKTNVSIVDAGTVAGTNAPFVQLLYCQKN